jgi:ketosteroid isomerase-like protein
MDSTVEVAKKLVAFCKQNKNLEAVETLYADHIVSVDAHGSDQMPKRMEGKPAVLGKNKWFFENHEIHSQSAQGPWPHDDRFIVTFTIDCTAKAGPMTGKRMQMTEAGLYTVKDGKIVKEEFFYDM